MSARILGIDPGFASIGWAVVDTGLEGTEAVVNVGVFTSQRAKQKGQLVCEDNRARAAYRELARVVREHRPDVVMAEGPAGAQGFSAAFGMGAGQGILAALVEAYDLPCDVCTPQAVKKLVGGAANASKEDVARGVCARFPGAPRFMAGIGKTKLEHAFDACAVIIVGLETSDLVRLARRAA